MFLALREIGRAKSRFALLGGAVGLLVFVLLFFQSVAGALESSLTGAIASQRADVIAFGDQARRNVESSLIPPAALEAAEGVEGVADVAAVGESVFTARAGGELIDAAVFGVDPQGPGAPTTLAAGRLPAADGEVAVSATGEPAGLGIGDEVTLEPGGTRVQVVGTVDDARYSALPTLYATYATYEAAVRARQPGQDNVPAALLAATVARGADPAAVAQRLDQRVEGVEALTKPTAVASLPAVESLSQSFSILYVLLYGVVGLVTGAFFLILTVQKRDALVLLRALGARRRDVIVPLVWQVVIVVGVGVGLGAALTVPAVGVAGEQLDATLRPGGVAVSTLVVLGLALVAAGAAVRRVLAIQPIEAVQPPQL
jgi:putative ABC transport system permease protein